MTGNPNTFRYRVTFLRNSRDLIEKNRKRFIIIVNTKVLNIENSGFSLST